MASDWKDLDLKQFMARYGDRDYESERILEDLVSDDRDRHAIKEIYRANVNLLEEACETRDWKRANRALGFFKMMY
jgi:hypothetical protein